MSEETMARECASSEQGNQWLRARVELILFVGVFLALMLVWELLSVAEVIPSIILPAPTAIAQALVMLVTAEWFPEHLWATAFETVAGFVVGSVLGVVLGILLANIALFRKIAYPYIIAFQVMPKVVLAPIFLTWFGFGWNSKIAMAAAIAFFPVVVNTVLGLESVEENAVLLMRSLVASKWQTFTKLAFPNALPAIFAGLETSATIALIGALVAEFVTARQGLGLLLTTFNFEMKMALVFAVIVVVSLVGLALYGVVAYAQHKIVFWHRSWEKEIL